MNVAPRLVVVGGSAIARAVVGGVGDLGFHGTVVDPVCGTTVDPETAAASVDHDGETYYFCCEGCADAFVERPEDHLGTA